MGHSVLYCLIQGRESIWQLLSNRCRMRYTRHNPITEKIIIYEPITLFYLRMELGLDSCCIIFILFHITSRNTINLKFPISFESQRNATGHIIHSDGVEKHLIEELSQMLNFRCLTITLFSINKITMNHYPMSRSYCYLPDVANLPDDTPFARGAISYLVNDVILVSLLVNL